MTTPVRRAALVAAARTSIARGSKSFAAASRLLDRQTRERVWLLYAWCRACDDLADGQDHGGDMTLSGDAPARIARIRAQTDAALNGSLTGDDGFDGLAVVVSECGIPGRYVDDVIAGFALDGDGWQPQTEDDLMQYCYHVAGAVGRMMAILLRVAADDDELLDRATDLGIAFQLANIARDIAEDAGAGRCYLPANWLTEAAIPPDRIMAAEHRPALTALAARLCALSVRYEASARVGAARLPWRSRWAILSAAGIYGDIARRVAKAGEHAWDGRITVGRPAKLARVGGAAVAALLPAPVCLRDDLWTLPRK